jgi:GT2 family glycosyltransferase
MKKKPLVTIQILNWNRADETLRAIKSAQNQTYSNFEIVVIDNGSTDDSIQKVETFFPQVKLVKLDKNYGCPGGRNRGISASAGEYIFFCDNDGVLHKNAVLNAIECIQKDESIAVVTGLVKDFTTEKEIDTQYQLPTPEFSNIHVFQGGITLHRKFIYTEIDTYPDDYIYGGEETYLSMRVMDAGYKVVKCEQSILWHKKSAFARDVKKELLQAWSNTLATAYQLYPLKYFLIYFCYYWIVYPFYAIRHGFLFKFFKSSGKTLKRLNNYKRKPIRRNTYRDYNKLKTSFQANKYL